MIYHHIRWIYPTRPPCEECGEPMRYSGATRSGRSRYVICPKCGHRGVIVPIGREMRDERGRASLERP